jgi:hypothetical protein
VLLAILPLVNDVVERQEGLESSGQKRLGDKFLMLVPHIDGIPVVPSFVSRQESDRRHLNKALPL